LADRGLVAVTGRNGSGKSTLLKIFAGLLRPSSGRVEISSGGAARPPDRCRRLVGWSSPEVEFFDELSGAENLHLLARAAGLPCREEDVRARLSQLGLQRAASRRIAEYSSGMKQRVRLAFSLLADPPILLWDEPFSNLDEDGTARGMAAVEERRSAGLVLIATNDRRDLSQPDAEVVLS